ncbi:MAG: Na+/H+ antiporter NhaD/arsenite permease-like protein [Candidatus Marinamargulisbacteria bacterium]|jgi:Na+/H+ antiporter NhaD/arsenite permease-like protein
MGFGKWGIRFKIDRAYYLKEIVGKFRVMKMVFRVWFSALVFFATPTLVEAAEKGIPHLDGALLSIWWLVPFGGILLSIAFLPLLAPHFWKLHYGKVALFWAGGLMSCLFAEFGFSVAFYEFLHTMLLAYMPFIILLLCLFTVAGGIVIKGTLKGSPVLNVAMLISGTLLASWIGTTGAAMVLIRPLLRANQWREKKSHVVIFFIFLVANVGGSLTPLGDPPLFLGFLNGVDFFWPTMHMLGPMMLVSSLLWGIFYLLDSYYYQREPEKERQKNDQIEGMLGLEGGFNIILLLAAVETVLISGLWTPETNFEVFHVVVRLENVVRDVVLLWIAFVSVKVTPPIIHERNDFTWHPILEVAKLFVGIFVTIIPVIAMIKAQSNSFVKLMVQLLFTAEGEPRNGFIFWVTGIHSSLLDNAPSYLVFFNALGGNAYELMNDMPGSLLAISAGSVFMGALTYIGNAPNFMVKSIAEDMSYEMPSFFGYIFKYAIPILVPIFIIVTIFFF